MLLGLWDSAFQDHFWTWFLPPAAQSAVEVVKVHQQSHSDRNFMCCQSQEAPKLSWPWVGGGFWDDGFVDCCWRRCGALRQGLTALGLTPGSGNASPHSLLPVAHLFELQGSRNQSLKRSCSETWRRKIIPLNPKMQLFLPAANLKDLLLKVMLQGEGFVLPKQMKIQSPGRTDLQGCVKDCMSLQPALWFPQLWGVITVGLLRGAHSLTVVNSLFPLSFFFSFSLFMAVPVTCGSSQARGWIRAVAASLCHSPSNARSEPCLQPTPQLTANTGSPTQWARPGMEPASSRILARFLNCWELLFSFSILSLLPCTPEFLLWILMGKEHWKPRHMSDHMPTSNANRGPFVAHSWEASFSHTLRTIVLLHRGHFSEAQGENSPIIFSGVTRK